MDSRTAMQLKAIGIDPARLPPGALIGGKPIDRAGEPIIQVEACPNGTVRIEIPGTPIGKPRMTRQDKFLKRPPVQRYRDWCNRVLAAVRGSIPPAETVAEVNFTAYFEPPASWPKKKRVAAIGTRHRSKPDRDNIDKAILDCLWPGGDSALADGTIRKRWDWKARLEIEIITETS